MPLYEYKCPKCGIFNELRNVKERNHTAVCPSCLTKAEKVFSTPNIVTDTNFCGTGFIDPRVCESVKDPIRGRKDWQRRLDEKNLRVLDRSELEHPKMPKPEPVMNDDF